MPAPRPSVNKKWKCASRYPSAKLSPRRISPWHPAPSCVSPPRGATHSQQTRSRNGHHRSDRRARTTALECHAMEKSDQTTDKDAPLRYDIRLLGRILGETVRAQEGD